jgi:PLP dependent protein
MSEIAENLRLIRQRISNSCHKIGRCNEDVQLIAVSKFFSADAVRKAYESGQLVFGENKQQEAEAKILLLPSLLEWHFIGQLQRNKVRKILSQFSVIHSVDSLRLAKYVNEIARELGLFPKVFLQINLVNELTKGGFSREEIFGDFNQLISLDRLEIIGLMTIPPSAIPEGGRLFFASLRELRDDIAERFNNFLPMLSMGMSNDFEIAIEEGATHVRVGSAIFGRRIRAEIN